MGVYQSLTLNCLGTRSVSTLTPSQLARKRANDREAQRAIRARTKEHIERLEQELEDLKSKQSRDQTVQELLRRNRALQDELNRLKENMGVSMTSSPYSTPGITARHRCVPEDVIDTLLVYDDNLSTASGPIPSPRTSPFPTSDYNALPDYNQQYVPLPNNCETWANTVPCPVPSNVSSPSSSDDYSTGYIPTSVPTSLLPSTNNSTPNLPTMAHEKVKMEFDEVENHGMLSAGMGRGGPEEANSHYSDQGFRLSSNTPLQQAHPSYMQQQQPWNVYPVYYPQAQSSVH